MSSCNVVVLHEAKDLRKLWAQRLSSAGFAVREATSLTDALPGVEAIKAPLVVCGACNPVGTDPLHVVKSILGAAPKAAVIFIATDGSEELAVRALRAGVVDYIRRPLDFDDLIGAVTRSVSKLEQTGAVPSQSGDQTSSSEALTHPIVGNSSIMQDVKARLLRAAGTDSNVLITGETGTGKELAAQLIHTASSRSTKRLVSVNCAAIPDTLLESELFGYEKGAFTGAQWGNVGLLEKADGGTLFLDEVAEMSPIAQAKVLRVLESKELSRVGGRETIRVNIRLVAATNQNIENMIQEHRFRADLYFRLNVLRINLPSLRNRKQDLPALIAHFVQQFNHTFGRRVKGLSSQSYEQLLSYNWPGNIRELRNLLEAAFVNAPSENAPEIDLPTDCIFADSPQLGIQEKERVIAALLATKWNKSEAAKRLHWSRMTLYRKMNRYHLGSASDDQKVQLLRPVEMR